MWVVLISVGLLFTWSLMMIRVMTVMTQRGQENDGDLTMLPSRSGEKGGYGKKTGGYSWSGKLIVKRASMILFCFLDTKIWKNIWYIGVCINVNSYQIE